MLVILKYRLYWHEVLRGGGGGGLKYQDKNKTSLLKPFGLNIVLCCLNLDLIFQRGERWIRLK